jgi:hypothetical protein
MSTIINIRGTSGSGKTMAVRKLMARYRSEPFGESDRKPDGYVLMADPKLDVRLTYVIGSYENVCGGCDGIHTQEEARQRVRTYVNTGHVIFEGLLLSTIFDSYRLFDREMTGLGHKYIWAFLDTPIQLCIDRVKSRRAERSETKPLDESKTRSKWETMRRIQMKCKAAGLDVRILSHEDPVPQLWWWLNGYD